MFQPFTMPRSVRIGGAFLAAGALVVQAAGMSAIAADDPTVHAPNGPANCVTTNSDGTLNTDPGSCSRYGAAGVGRTDARAKNVILIIGDGMGQQEITAARNYLEGAGGRFQGLDNLTATGMYTHHSINKDGSINYVTDSAASGTAWATGTKTYNGALGVDVAGRPEINLIEVAKNAGMRTGNVTTSEIQDATPGAVSSHSSTRSCYAPSGKKSTGCDKDQRVNGGLGSISEQIIDTRADVTLGGGASYFNARVKANSGNTNPFLTGSAKYPTNWVAGQTVLENARNNGYQVVTNVDEFDAVSSADQKRPLLGLFAPGNMTRAFAPSAAVVGGGQGTPITCQEVSPGKEPEVADMTRKAIELLNRPSDSKGFFLQVESASIDKADHAADACGQIGETRRLDQVVQEAVDFAKADGNTLVIVTADHSHTSQIVYDGGTSVSPTTRLLTHDGATMSIAYGTRSVDASGNPAGSQQHTGAQLRIAAYGPGSENVLGQTDQTDVFFTIRNALGLGTTTSRASNRMASTVAATPASALPAPVDSNGVNGSCYLVQADGTVASGQAACAQYGKKGQQRSKAKATNVILFIGDGMGDSEITSARNYLYGASGTLPGLDALAYTGSYTHFSLSKEKTADGNMKPDYVTDSAASGTAWATGTKTYNGAVSVDLAGRARPNLVELAKEKGLRTGNVSTAEIQDATPAVMGAHVSTRSCFSPSGYKSDCASDQRINGGYGSISEQLVDTRADVILGGGKRGFDQTVEAAGIYHGKGYKHTWEAGKSVLDNAKAQGYRVATNAKELEALQAGDKPVIGLFASGNMPRHFLESTPTVDGARKPAQRCQINPARTSELPDLAQMTTKAIELLDRSAQGDHTGFFLQVEGASIDKADHGGDACGQIGELDDLDKAIQAARAWVAKSGEPTLIIATADHAHTSQITSVGTPTAGVTSNLLTAEGYPMVINYATSADTSGGGHGHTGSQLRIAAEGPGAENVVGQLDQTDTHYLIANVLDLNTDKEFVENRFKLGEKEPEPTPSESPSVQPQPNDATPTVGDPSAAASSTPSGGAKKKAGKSASSKKRGHSLAYTGASVLGLAAIAGTMVVGGAIMRRRRGASTVAAE